MITIEITGAVKEALQQVYEMLNSTNCTWHESTEGEVVSITIDDETIMHSEFLAFVDLLIDLNVEWEELES